MTTFVYEQTSDGKIVRGKRCQSQCQCQTDNERLASRKGIDVALLVEHVAIYDFERQCSGNCPQFVTGRKLAQMEIGVLHQIAESIALGLFAEAAAVGAAYQ